MVDKKQPSSNDAAGIPDLNDPSMRFGREEAMDAMRARRRETVKADMLPEDIAAAAGDEDTDAADAEAERIRLAELADVGKTSKANKPNEGLDTATQVAAQTAPLTLEDDELDSVQVRVKVNGKEKTMSIADMRAMAQKNEAADDNLRQSKEVLREMQELARQQQAGKGAPANTETEDPGNTSQDDPIDEALAAMFEGDQEKASKLLKKAVGRGNATQGNQDDAAAAIEQRIVIRSALRQFAKDHKEISNDEIARGIADRFLYGELEKLGVKRLEELNSDDIPEVIDRAGSLTSAYFKEKAGLAPAAASKATTTLSERRKAKEGIDELPTAGTRAAGSAQGPKSPSDVIAQMAAARGQHRDTTPP